MCQATKQNRVWNVARILATVVWFMACSGESSQTGPSERDNVDGSYTEGGSGVPNDAATEGGSGVPNDAALANDRAIPDAFIKDSNTQDSASREDARQTSTDGSTPVDTKVTSDSAVSAGDAPGDTGAAECSVCSMYSEPKEIAQIQVGELDSLSGLASSRSNPGIFFAHNDHNRPVVYALDLQGALHARISLEGATAADSDIEDIALGPCPEGQCIYLADIGDNFANRTDYAILRFTEPEVPSSTGDTVLTVSFERFPFVYEDGSHNAEAIMVAPSQRVYVVTKSAQGNPSEVYALPIALSSNATSNANRATQIATLPVPTASERQTSAAAAHPCGLGFLVRTYDHVYEFRVPAGGDFETAFDVTPSVVGAPPETQSEGIDYLPDGVSIISSGEGRSASIYQTICK